MGRKLAIMAAAGLSAMAFGTGTAHAEAYSCVLNTDGVAGDISPGVGTSPFTGGTYTFDGTANCTIGGNRVGATIHSEGTFDNIFCGTGNVYNAWATITDTDGVAPNHGQIYAEYEIQFVGTAGALTVTKLGTNNNPTGGGAVQIRPQDPVNDGCSGDGVNTFLVTGAFAANG